MIKAWIAAGVAGVLLLALLVIQSLRLDAAQLREKAAFDADAAKAAVIERYKADAALAARLAAEQAAALAALKEQSDARQNAIRRAPPARCADIPACRVYLDGLRARGDQAAGGRPAAAAGAGAPVPR